MLHLLFIICVCIFYIMFLISKINLLRRQPPHRIIMPFYVIIEDVPQNTDAQNTHDPIVRSSLWQKFSIIYENTKNIEQIVNASIRHAKYYINPLKDPKLNNILDTIDKNYTVTTASEKLPETISEKIVFGLVWHEFIQKKIDLNILINQLKDCYEDDTLVCISGRVARYISAFEGVTEGPLGESEVTENILFKEALNETKKLYDKSKSQIQKELLSKYPQLKNRIHELLEAF